jgi:hypothetical protein
MDLIASNPGRILRVDADVQNGGEAILVVGEEGSETPTRLPTFEGGIVVTSVLYSQEANVQFMQTLRDAIYVYSFGDKMGDIQITGLCVPYVCAPPGSSADDSVSGIRNIMSYYAQHRVSADLNPINVVLAQEVIVGFLVGCKINTVDASSYIHQFVLLLKALPRGNPSYPGFSGSESSSNSDDNRVSFDSSNGPNDELLLAPR